MAHLNVAGPIRVAGLASEVMSSYETGKKVPSLLIMLKYSRAAGIAMEALVEDDLDQFHKQGKS